MSDPDYSDRFEAPRSNDDTRPAVEWFQAAFEGAPFITRSVLLTGWRIVLLMRLAPRDSPGHVLGWLIVADEPALAKLHAESPLMRATLSVSTATNSSAVWTTEVWYKRTIARPIWLVVGLVHRRIVPHRLKAATKQ
jgi:hypothetical protein